MRPTLTIPGVSNLAPLGQGGMGNVYRGVDAAGRAVAVKVTRKMSKPALARFQREAELLARFRSPEVVTAHAWGVTEQFAYLVCDLVEGQTLDLAARSLPLDQQLQLLVAVCRAAGVAHAAGVVHRDLKPSNVLVTPEGHVRLIDFGVSIGMDQQRLTQTGGVIGTPTYMPPEQFEGGKPDPASDVWSLGAIAYEVLAGRPPFMGETLVEMMAARDRPPPSLAGATTRAVDAVIQRALKSELRKRYSDGSALASALEAAIHAPRPSTSKGLLLAVGLVLVVSGTLIAWASSHDEPSAPPTVVEPPPELPPAPEPEPTPSAPAPLSAPQREALNAALQLTQALDFDPVELEYTIDSLRGALRADDPEAARLANQVTAGFVARKVSWLEGGQSLLEALAKTGARPTDRPLAERFLESLYWELRFDPSQRFDAMAFAQGLLVMIQLDVEVEFGNRILSEVIPLKPLPGQRAAVAYLNERFWFQAGAREDVPLARRALLELSENLELGPKTRARALALGLPAEPDPARRLELAARARELDPESSNVLLACAWAQVSSGKVDEGIASIHRGIEAWFTQFGERDGIHEVWEDHLQESVRVLLNVDRPDACDGLLIEPRIPRRAAVFNRMRMAVARYRAGELDENHRAWLKQGGALIRIPRATR